jgi:hypothetical protein
MGRDLHADAIVSSGKDTHVPLGNRSVEAVKTIVHEYYDESMLSEVGCFESEGGLSTAEVGSGSDIKGKVTADKYFEHIDALTRRVLEVAHELQLIRSSASALSGR